MTNKQLRKQDIYANNDYLRFYKAMEMVARVCSCKCNGAGGVGELKAMDYDLSS